MLAAKREVTYLSGRMHYWLYNCTSKTSLSVSQSIEQDMEAIIFWEQEAAGNQVQVI